MEKHAFLFIFLGCAFQLACSTNSKDSLTRNVQNDDILTPSDFLIVAKRLLEKVEYPGVGKGIVSSSKTNQQLADKLFQRFFFTNARFSAVRLFDIPGLDSIQALALSGDEFEPIRQFLPLEKKDFIKGLPARCRYKLMTKKIEKKKPNKGHHKKVVTDTRKSEKQKIYIEKSSHINRQKITREIDDTVEKHRLILEKNNRHKREAVSDNSTTAAPVTQNGRRIFSPHTIPQAKKLLKNRMLVIKTNRKKREVGSEKPSKANNNTRRDSRRKSHEGGHGHHRVSSPALDTTRDPDMASDDKDGEDPYEFIMYNKMKHEPPTTMDKVNCYWRYKCPDKKMPFFTCELFPECEDSKSDHFIRDDIPIAHTADEHDANFLRFRREVGVYLVDEEVEKIFEHRYLILMRPRKEAKLLPGKNMEKQHGTANLQFYFQNLIRAEKATSTTTMAPPHKQDTDKRKREHNYKYLRAKIPYSDVKMQKQIKEAQEKKLKQVKSRQREDKFSSQQKEAVISMSMAVTSPLPDFMHQMKKK